MCKFGIGIKNVRMGKAVLLLFESAWPDCLTKQIQVLLMEVDDMHRPPVGEMQDYDLKKFFQREAVLIRTSRWADF
ncbi:MAG: hypothetical protein CL609_04875 [Anaerolineaceae bacterium]|nr:hypothetical protein [Anaerolineaceae bacterium]